MSERELKDLIASIEEVQSLRPVSTAALVKIIEGAVEIRRGFWVSAACRLQAYRDDA